MTIVRTLLAGAACFAVMSSAGRLGAHATSIADALDNYNRGNFHDAVQDVGTQRPTIGGLTSEAERWIAAGDPAKLDRRRLVAAAFALDVAWTIGGARDSQIELGPTPSVVTDPRSRWSGARFDQGLLNSGPLAISWACAQISSITSPPTVAERWWWLASIGVLDDRYAWQMLAGSTQPSPGDLKKILKTLPPANVAAMKDFIDGHIAHARTRVPDEPRWQLDDVVARSSRDIGPNWNSGRIDLLHADKLPAGKADAVSRAEKSFSALTTNAALAGEAELHLGYLALERNSWTTALTHFDLARTQLSEPIMLAVTDYFAGWVDEHLGRRADAIATYRRAYALAPKMRNLATLLAADLFLTPDRAEAYPMLDNAFSANPPPLDLLTIFRRGDARLVNEYRARMQEALR